MSLSTYFHDFTAEPFFGLSDFDRLFDAAWDSCASKNLTRCQEAQSPSEASRSWFRPRMDFHESKENNEVTLTLEIPGAKKEDITVDIQNNRLIVSGQTVISDSLEKEGYTLRERRFGRFSRVIPLPSGNFKAEDVKASMDNGVLTIKFPRTQPEHEAKRVTIS